MFDVGQYIASGAIEACLMGLATPEETAEMNRLASLYPEIAVEIAAIQASLDGLHLAAANTYRRSPDPRLKAKVLAAAFAEVPERKTPSPNTTPTAPKAIQPARILMPILAVMGLTSALVLGWLWQQSDARARQLQSKVDDQAISLEHASSTTDSLRHALATAYHQKDSIWMACAHMVELKGLPMAPDARAFVYWDNRSGEVMAKVEMLPETPSGKEYQLWAIVGGKPVDLGMFHMQGVRMPVAAMKSVMDAEAFAVTLEKAGGSPSPTMEQMYVLGSV